MTQWKEKVVVVTGGSSGLGVAIARQFALAGGRVVCVARNAENLRGAAAQIFKAHQVTVATQVADVTNDESVSQAVAQILETYGRIDVWVNNVGKSIRVPLAAATVEDFADLMEVNFYSVVRCARAVLPELERSGGSFISIGSLASKTGWPFLAPYSASKHALAAWHHQLRLEGPKSVNHLLVCPGPIRRNDAGTRYAEQTDGLADSAKQPGAGANLKGIDPDRLAVQIRVACERRRAEVVVPWKARVAFALTQLSPKLGDRLLKMFAK